MNTADVLRYGQGTFLQAVESVADADRELPGACGVWSVRDLVAHIGSYELVLVDVLRSLEGETGTPHLDRIISLGPDFNDAEVDARRDRSLPALLDELGEAHTTSVRLAEAADSELLRRPGTIPWYGEEYAFEDLVVYQYYGHKREHAAQIEMFRDHAVYRLRAGVGDAAGG